MIRPFCDQTGFLLQKAGLVWSLFYAGVCLRWTPSLDMLLQNGAPNLPPSPINPALILFG